MAVGVPGHLHVGVPEPPRDLLDIDTLVDEQGSVRVPEVVNAYVRQSCGAGESLVVVLNRRVPEGNFAAAHAVFLAEQSVSFLLTALVFGEYLHQRCGDLQVAVAGLILRRTLDVAALDLLRNAPAYVQDISVNVRPFQRVYLALACPGVERDTEEYIERPVRHGPGAFLCFGDVSPELLRGVVVQLVRGLLDGVGSLEVPESAQGIPHKVLHFHGVVQHSHERRVCVLFRRYGELFVGGDVVLPLREDRLREPVKAITCHSRHYPEPQVLHRAVVGGLARFVAVVDLVLVVELLDGHARNDLLLVLVFSYQGLLQRVRFCKTVCRALYLASLARRVGVVHANAVLLQAVLLNAGFVYWHVVAPFYNIWLSDCWAAIYYYYFSKFNTIIDADKTLILLPFVTCFGV